MLALALVVSGVAHVVTAWWVNRLPPERRGNNRTAITITFNTPPPKTVSPSDVTPDHNARRQKPVPPAPRPEKPRPNGQIVKLPPEKSVPPKDARFVSETDHAVEKETRATETDPESAAAHEKQKEKGVPPPSEQDREEEELERGEEEPSPSEGAENQRAPQLLGGNPGFNSRGLMSMWRQAEAANQQGSAGRSTQPSPWDRDAEDRPSGKLVQGPMAGSTQRPSGPVNLNLDDNTLSRIAGGAPANDSLDEVEPGTGTYLNALQWQYAAYFNAISDKVRRQWRPQDVLRRHGREHSDLHGGVPRRFTLVEITLDHSGHVKLTQVDRYSGNDDLDEEAGRAIRAAGPFPNPPEPLFEGHDTFSFKFGFTVTFEGDSSRSAAPFRFGVPTR